MDVKFLLRKESTRRVHLGCKNFNESTYIPFCSLHGGDFKIQLQKP
jgi:hypothetical protein